MLNLIEPIVKKYGGEYHVASGNFDVGAGEIVDFRIGVVTNYYYYIHKISGYVTESNVKVTFIDNDGMARWTWDNFPDFMITTEVIPFLEKRYSGWVTFRYINSSANTASCSLMVTLIEIPATKVNEFERDVMNLSNLIKG